MQQRQAPRELRSNPSGPLHPDTSSYQWGVLVLHGFTSGPYSVSQWGQDLAEAGAHVSIPLLPGHGTTPDDLAQTSFTDWQSHVRDSYDALRKRVDKIAVAGLSMGGTLALDVAAHRAVDAVFLVNPGLSFSARNTVGAALSPLLKYVVPATAPIADDIAKPGMSEYAYASTPTAAVEELAKLIIRVNRLLPTITAPIHLFRSEHDSVVPESSVKRLQRHTDATTVTTIPLPNSYHVATLDYDAPLISEQTVYALSEYSR